MWSAYINAWHIVNKILLSAFILAIILETVQTHSLGSRIWLSFAWVYLRTCTSLSSYVLSGLCRDYAVWDNCITF